MLCCWGKGKHWGPEPAHRSLPGWKADIGLGVVASSSCPWHLCLLAPEKKSIHVLFAPQVGWGIPRFICHLHVAVSALEPWTELLALLQEERDVEGTLLRRECLGLLELEWRL